MEQLHVRIDRDKVDRYRQARGLTWNELGERTRPHGLSLRKMYDVLDSYEWHTKHLNALCAVLGCRTVDIISFDLEKLDPKADAPNEGRRTGLKFSLTKERTTEHPVMA